MHVLEGAMAFAVAMIIFSTIATGLVEVILRTWNIKPSNLRKSMSKLVDTMVDEEMPHLKDPQALIAGAGITADQKRVFEVAKSAWRDRHPDHPPGTPIPKAELDKIANGLLRKWGHDWASRRIRYVDALTRNPSKSDAPNEDMPYRELADRFRVEALSGYAFLQRLAATELGAEIAAQAKEAAGKGFGVDPDAMQDVWQDQLRRFERYRATGNETFRRHAQRTTITVAIILALGFNIDAARLFSGVMSDDALRTALIEQGDAAFVANQAQADRTKRTAELLAIEAEAGEAAARLNAVDRLRTGMDRLLPAMTTLDGTEDQAQALRDALASLVASDTGVEGLSALDNAVTGLAATLQSTEITRGLADDLSSVLSEFQKDLRIIDGDPADIVEDFPSLFDGLDETPGLPVGFQYWPHCTFLSTPSPQPQCDQPLTIEDAGALVAWFLKALVAGFLIGLGGPFWYRVFTSLSQLTGALKAFGRRSGNVELLDQSTPENGEADAKSVARAQTATLMRIADKADKVRTRKHALLVHGDDPNADVANA